MLHKNLNARQGVSPALHWLIPKCDNPQTGNRSSSLLQRSKGIGGQEMSLRYFSSASYFIPRVKGILQSRNFLF